MCLSSIKVCIPSVFYQELTMFQELPAVRYTMINETCKVSALSEPKF